MKIIHYFSKLFTSLLRFANHVLRPAAEPAETYLSKLLPRVSALMRYGRETFPDRELPDRAQSGKYFPGVGRS